MSYSPSKGVPPKKLLKLFRALKKATRKRAPCSCNDMCVRNEMGDAFDDKTFACRRLASAPAKPPEGER